MHSGWLLIAIILVGLYVILRIDLLPDVIPVIGWLDDTFLVGLLIYYFRYKKLPRFLRSLGRFFFKGSGSAQNSGQGRSENQGQGSGAHGAGSGGSGRVKDPYAVLGVRKGAGREEIQAAYREAVQKYHPDKVSHLGDEFQQLAQQKFVEIQNAYDQLKDK